MGLILGSNPPAWTQPQEHTEFDDCESHFIAFIGADAYQFAPGHSGTLGSVRLFSVLSYQLAAAKRDYGQAFWRLTISSKQTGRTVFRTGGIASILDQKGTALAEVFWNGRDQRGRLVPDGAYAYTFEARFLPSRLPLSASSYEDLAGQVLAPEAQASTDTVIVNRQLSDTAAFSLRVSALAQGACELQQNAPMEPGFGYNFYYGSTHAHSNFSDGGQATTSCTSGAAYGSGPFAPADVFNYAKLNAGLDFWVINEHNHLINDSVSTNNGPVTEAKVRQRYQDGRAAADAATIDGQFVGLYGMEWGVTTNADQGHVTLIETPALFGWETCTNCNGPAIECTPGTNCYFDVFTPKRFGYLTMYQRSVENPSPAGALGIFAHPSSGQFDNFAFNANADDAIQGIAVRSGLAFSTTENCADTNVGSTDYSARWRDALNRGFHVAPIADHDSHCNNFGNGIPTRTVYLLPNNVPTPLTKIALLQAHKARHFYATEDPNLQLIFGTADGAQVMGDIFNAGSSVTLRASVNDPTGGAVSTLELWRGQIGAGTLTAPYQTFSGVSTFSITENLTSGTYYYFVRGVQTDGHDFWSAPMWITYSATDTTAPVVSITAPTNGATVSGAVTVSATATDAVGVTSVEFLVDGVLQATDNTSPYSFSWSTTGVNNGAHSLQARASDAAGNIGTSTAVSVTVNNDSTPPTVSINAPANGATVSGVIAVNASAADNVGVTAVEFYLNGIVQATDTSSPYSWSWNTAASPNAVHSLTARALDAAGNHTTSAAVSVTTSNDLTPPTTAITAPAAGATVSGTTTVIASAADNVGVTQVQFYLDGVLQSTDAAAPYEWSWNTTSTTNASHSLTSRAFDAAGNFTTSAAISVTVNNAVLGTNIGGWRIVQANAAITYTIPSGTVIPDHGYLVIGRNATKAQFEAFWGVTLGANVVYLNGGDVFPQINGSENYDLRNAANTRVDGKTISMSSAAGQSLRRINPCSGPNQTSNWSVGATTLATPGLGAGAGCAKGVVINEFSDAVGTGNFIYEFIELHNDK